MVHPSFGGRLDANERYGACYFFFVAGAENRIKIQSIAPLVAVMLTILPSIKGKVG